jgi:GAF domain-containing protein
MLGNVTVLERPTRVAAFVSAIQAALRARRRQYQVRNHLDEREATARATMRHSEQLHRLTEVLPLINAAVDVPSILTVLCAQARELIGARRCDAILMRDPASHHPITVTSFSAEESDASYARRTGEHRVVAPPTATSAEAPLAPTFLGLPRVDPATTRPPLRERLSAPLVDSDGRNMGHLHLSRSYAR